VLISIHRRRLLFLDDIKPLAAIQASPRVVCVPLFAAASCYLQAAQWDTLALMRLF
jgi:hypothetical protein